MDKMFRSFSKSGEAANFPHLTPTAGYRFEQNALSACSCFFSCLAALGSLRIRFTCWLIDAGWPIARRSVIHSLLTEVRRFTNAAHTTPVTLPAISKLCVATLTVATLVFGFWPQPILTLLR